MKTQVKAFLPIDITDDRLVSSSISEPDESEPLWVADRSFAEFEAVSVISKDSHLVYESLQSGNLNHPPATSPDWWIKRSYTNRFRMFNWYHGNPSVGQSPLTVVIRPGQRINALVLKGLKATVLEVIVRKGIDGPIVYTIDGYLLARHATTPYKYCFGKFVYNKVVSTFNIPPIADPVVYVTLEDPSGTCELEKFGVGMSVDIGQVDWNSVSDDGSYSDVEFDRSGWPTLKPNQGTSTLDMKLGLDAIRVNEVVQFKKLSNNKIVFWSAMEGIESYRQMHVMIGIPEKFMIVTENHRQATVDLILRGI